MASGRARLGTARLGSAGQGREERSLWPEVRRAMARLRVERRVLARARGVHHIGRRLGVVRKGMAGFAPVRAREVQIEVRGSVRPGTARQGSVGRGRGTRSALAWSVVWRA